MPNVIFVKLYSKFLSWTIPKPQNNIVRLQFCIGDTILDTLIKVVSSACSGEVPGDRSFS